MVMNENAVWLHEILIQHLLCIRYLRGEDGPCMDSKKLARNERWIPLYISTLSGCVIMVRELAYRSHFSNMIATDIVTVFHALKFSKLRPR